MRNGAGILLPAVPHDLFFGELQIEHSLVRRLSAGQMKNIGDRLLLIKRGLHSLDIQISERISGFRFRNLFTGQTESGGIKRPAGRPRQIQKHRAFHIRKQARSVCQIVGDLKGQPAALILPGREMVV